MISALVFLVALNLRPAITSVGPLLPVIGQDQHLSESMQGVLGALPVLAFALVSPLVVRLEVRIGPDRSVLTALLGVAGGLILRSYAGSIGLWTGTFVVGAAIAIANVLLPTIVKRDYAGRVSGAVAGYTACLSLAAAGASAAAVPLAEAMNWNVALAVWAVPALVVASLWLVRVAHPPTAASAEHPTHGLPGVWRQPAAWLITAFMGLQSTVFYVVITWLPTIEETHGISGSRAGVHLFVYQFVGVAAGLTVPLLMGPGSLTFAAVASTACSLVGLLGLLLDPSQALLWDVILGLGSGSSLVVALALISLRGRSARETTQLSGMAQSLGYLLAASGPIVVGSLAQATGSWRAGLAVVAALATVQLVVAVPAGRPRVEDRKPIAAPA